MNTHTQTSVASHGICGCVWSEEEQGLTGPRCPGLGLQALENWRVAPLHEVQLFFRHAWGPVKISLMGRDRHLRALHPQDLWMSDAYTVPKSLTWHTSGCQCLTVMCTQINNNIHTHTSLYCIDGAVSLQCTCTAHVPWFSYEKCRFGLVLSKHLSTVEWIL